MDLTIIVMLPVISYIIMGILTTVLMWYVSDSVTADELLLVFLFWSWILVHVITTEGIKNTIQEGFINDKKGFFIRLMIMILCLIVMGSVVVFFDNILVRN